MGIAFVCARGRGIQRSVLFCPETALSPDISDVLYQVRMKSFCQVSHAVYLCMPMLLFLQRCVHHSRDVVFRQYRSVGRLTKLPQSLKGSAVPCITTLCSAASSPI